MAHFNKIVTAGQINRLVLQRLLGTVVCACAAFGLIGTMLLLVAQPPAVEGMTLGLLVRLALFTLFLGTGVILVHRGRTYPEGTPKYASEVPYPLLPLFPALLFVCMLVFPNLSSWPRSAPDEVHHLIVARNIAEYGVFGSGHPDSGFKLFDSFDSVGPAVLFPVAAAFKMAGTSLGTARVTMGLFYLLFSIALFLLLRRPYGPAAAAAGIVLATCGFSSIYLGRTLYGEVPAMAYFLFGLVSWRRGIQTAHARWFAVAGVLFALAVLSKTIFILMAFPFLAAWWHDRCSWKRIPLRAIFIPALPAALLLGSWWLLVSLKSPEGASVLQLYQHYLLIGISPLPGNLRILATQPMAHLVYFIVLFVAGHQLFGRRYDPALVVFYSFGFLILFWWLFYTPGQIARYRWPFYVMSGALLGSLLIHMTALWLLRLTRMHERVVVAMIVITAVVPSVVWLLDQSREVYENGEMAGDKKLAAFVNDLPEDATVVTTSHNVRGTLNFLCNRAVDGGAQVETLLTQYNVVIVLEDAPLPEVLSPAVKIIPLPPYVVMTSLEETAKS